MKYLLILILFLSCLQKDSEVDVDICQRYLVFDLLKKE
jgi:hypothetical protein